MNSRRVALVVAGTVAAVGVVAFAVFRPDKLVVDERVDDQLAPDVAAALEEPAPPMTAPAPDAPLSTAPAQTAPPATAPLPAVLGSGEFVAQAGHRISGRAVVLDVDGARQLVLDELDAENGPDLRVYLSPSSAGSVDGGVQIDTLKGNQGTQTYDLPADVDLAALPHVVIWCERFDVPFGTATVSA